MGSLIIRPKSADDLNLDAVALDLFERYRKANALQLFGCHLVIHAAVDPTQPGSPPEAWIVLLSERKEKKYSLPGGKGEPGDENPQAILRREIKEELGQDLNPACLKLVAISSDRGDPRRASDLKGTTAYVSLLYETTETMSFSEHNFKIVRPSPQAVVDKTITEFTVRHFKSLQRVGRM